ncbi:MAG TPA: GNAT family N-acetyltransferase [Tepidisphaeraceae bacterium]|jgi:RimJ/RimL family protein N-acetyltransferase
MWPIRTPRLCIRPFAEGDLDAISRLLDDCFGRESLAARRAWLDWTVRNYAALARLRQPPYGDYAITLVDGGRIIGSVGLVPSFGPFGKLPSVGSHAREGAERDLFTAELGLFWAIESTHRRAGYATEAARAMAAFAFDELRAARVVATTEHLNAASIGVMRRLGMTIERNPDATPEWFQTVGVLHNSARGR